MCLGGLILSKITVFGAKQDRKIKKLIEFNFFVNFNINLISLGAPFKKVFVNFCGLGCTVRSN